MRSLGIWYRKMQVVPYREQLASLGSYAGFALVLGCCLGVSVLRLSKLTIQFSAKKEETIFNRYS